MLTKDEARKRVLESLESLKNHIAGEWPLTEAFTDLDDHPEEDEHGGFNYHVGYATGLCEAFGFEVLQLCAEVEPEPPQTEFFDDEDGAICDDCGERSDDPNHAANCTFEVES